MPKIQSFLKELKRKNSAESNGKKQTFQEWSMAGGGVPTQYKGREHVWHAKVKKFAEGGEVKMAGGGDPRGEMKAYDPTIRERMADALQRGIEGLGGNRYKARQNAQTLMGGPSSNLPINLGIADFVPFLGTGLGVDEGARDLGHAYDAVKRGDYVDAVANTVGAAAGLIPGAAGTIKGAKAAGRGALDLAKSDAAYNLSQKALASPALAAARPMNVVKPTGGNFLTGRTEKDLQPLKRGVIDEEATRRLMGDAFANERMADPVNNALNKWVDSNLTNYVKKQMGTPDDPVRKLAEQGITHKPGLVDEYRIVDEALKKQRREAGFPEEGMGQSPTAQAWERASDDAISTHRAGDIQAMPEKFAKFTEAERNMSAARASLDRKFAQHIENAGLNDREKASLIRGTSFADKEKMVGDTDFTKANLEFLFHQNPMMSSYIAIGRENPWISKVAPETQVYRPFTGDLGFDHIMDVLREDVTAGRIRPEQLNKVSMEQAVRRTYEYDQEMAAKANASRAAAREGLPTYKEYPEGYKWIELNQPGSFAQESEAMGHSVRGYEPPKGHPDWTEGSGDAGSSGYGHGGWEAIKSGKAKVYSLVDSKGAPHATVEVGQRPLNTWDDVTAAVGPVEAKKLWNEFDEIGGFGMSDVDSGFDLFIKQKGIKEPQKITQIKGKSNRAPNEEYLPYIQDFVKGGQWSDVGDLRNTGLTRKSDLIDKFSPDELDAIGAGEYLTKAEQDDLLLRALRPPEEGMAGGGAVRMGIGGAAKEVVEAGIKGVKKLLGAADEVPKGVEPIVVKPKPEPENYSQKVLDSTAARLAEKIAAANPKMKAEEVAKKSMNQAIKKLDWERTQKPALEKRYGALAKSSYAESNPIKQQNTPEVVQERMRKANEFLDIPTEAWSPPRSELQAFDRSSIKDALEGFPGVDQSKFPRDIPSRANIEHVEELYTDPANRALIEKQIKRGLPLGGESFYASLYPVKQAVLEAGMPAEKFDQWIYSLAPASARNSIMNEMAVGQFMRDMNARGIPLTEENVAREMAVYKEKFGIGLPLMPLHRQGVANVIEGGQNLRDMSLANIPTNYKIPTYGSQKAGDFANSVVLDVHEAGGQTQGSRFHPYFNEQGGFGNTEYNAGEQGMLGIAKDLGIPGGMAQAGRWFGGGELTGLKSPRGDALDLLEKQVAYTLQQKGVQPNPANVRAEVLRQIETGEGDLLPWYRKEGMPDVRQTGLQRAEGGEVNLDDPSLKKHQPLNIMFGKKTAQQHKRGGLPSIK
jgi:hypothetical protein